MIKVEAERSVAFKSPDYLYPYGTARDNHRNWRFNEKIYEVFKYKHKMLTVLDIGCSGGGFVKDCLDDGCLAIGIEGSDYSKKLKRAEWRTIPDNLFTGDITGEIDIYITDQNDNKERIIFDLITCWDVMEHFKEEDLVKVANNVKKHLSESGVWIMNVSTTDSIHDGVNLHQTVKPREWWIDKFRDLGLEHLHKFEKYFNEQYIRGIKYHSPNSFPLILTTNKKKSPKVPKLSFSTKLLDKYWYGSKSHKRLVKLILVRP